MDFAVKIPINCMDSLTYAKELDSLQLPHNFKGLILSLDTIAIFPNIPLQDSMETVRCFLHEDTTTLNTMAKSSARVMGSAI
jgi:hypothetical protein